MSGTRDAGRGARKGRVVRLLAYAGCAAALTAFAPRAPRPAPPVPHPAPRVARLTIARLQYDGGGDWYANPSSLPNLLAAIRERTSLDVDKTEARVRIMDDKLWDYPFLHVTGHGNIRLSDDEVMRLREYLTRGGFLHVSDNYGIDSSFRREISASSQIGSWSTSRSRTRSTTSSTTSRKVYQRFTSTMASRRVDSASSLETVSRSSMTGRAIWAMVGKITRSITIHRRCMKQRCGWG